MLSVKVCLFNGAQYFSNRLAIKMDWPNTTDENAGIVLKAKLCRTTVVLSFIPPSQYGKHKNPSFALWMSLTPAVSQTRMGGVRVIHMSIVPAKTDRYHIMI